MSILPLPTIEQDFRLAVRHIVAVTVGDEHQIRRRTNPSAAEAKSADSAFEGLYDKDAAVVQSTPAGAPLAGAPTDARSRAGYGQAGGGGYGGARDTAARSLGAGGYGGGISANGAARKAAITSAITVEELAEREKVVQNVRYVGSKSFFRRGDRWVDSGVNEKNEKNVTTAN